MPDFRKLNEIATQIRRDALRMIHAVNSGHPGGSLGCADLFTCLYFEVMHHDPLNFTMNGKGEDVFFLSNGHVTPAWYSVLARSGYFPVSELSTLRKIDSRLQGHPTNAEHLPGIRISSGSLGQGLSVAIGAAIAKKLNGDKHFIYSLHGDGELEEGQIWEAAMFASAKKIDNLISFIDYNGMQIDGPVEKVLSLGNLKAKWESFGWKVLETDGNKMETLYNSIKEAQSLTGKQQPVMILMKTEMGYPVDFMMGTHKWHGVAPDDKQLENALSQLPETIGDY